MTTFGRKIPIDRNGFFCTSLQSIEPSTEDTSFTFESPRHQPHTHDGSLSIDHSNNTKVTKSGDNISNTIITPEKTTEVSSKCRTNNPKTVSKGWVRAILEADPCIVTQRGLLLALQHNAPVQVIRFMLTINPNIMNIPKRGPTPLQVAVQNNANLDVVEVLLEASPFGLCIANGGLEDPLSYAKRHHSDRPGLIELLSRPLSYWVSERKSKIQDQNRQQQLEGKTTFPLSRYSSYPLQQTTNQVPQISPPPFSSRRSRTSSIISASSASEASASEGKAVLGEVKNASNSNNSLQTQSASQLPAKMSGKINKNKIDREEINNVKTLCAYLYKAHRKMAKQMITCKDDIENHSKLLETMGSREEILEELMKQQRSQMFRNWIALDIKERAYQSRLDKMEQQYVQELEKRLHSWTGSMRLWNESTREQIQELQSFVDSEVEINEQFRNNMTDWIEKYQQDQENNPSIPSHIFATNLGEVDEKAPLCCTTSPLKRVKKRPWRPLFKNRDRIPLPDDK